MPCKRQPGQFGLHPTYFSQALCEQFLINKRGSTKPCAVIIDGMDRAMQELGYLSAVVNAQSYECKYAQFGCQSVFVFSENTGFGHEHRIELVDKTREK